MPIHDHHENAYDAGTKKKLEIYQEYVKEFLPVFLNTTTPIRKIQFFDFFAGPGHDIAGEIGSPLITKTTIESMIESMTILHPRPIRIYLNELDPEKHNQLNACFEQRQCCNGRVTIDIDCLDFHEAFSRQFPTMAGNANLVFMDQNGISQVTKEIFQSITSIPRTDILFFLASSTANRFKTLPEIRQYLPLEPTDIENMNNTNVHRILADAYRRWLRPGQEYYIGSFSFKKGPNVYGLVFGSGHLRGIDKFLKIAWSRGGDADFDIDNDKIDLHAPSLFEEFNKPKKLTLFEQSLRQAVLSRLITTNKQAFRYAMESGCLGSHAKDTLKKMVEGGLLPQQAFAVSIDAWNKPEEKPILYETKGLT